MTYDRYKVIGLQRTGTNWIDQLIKVNFEIPQGGAFWKHLTPIGVKQDNKSYNHAMYKPEKSLKLLDNVFYIATYKDFDTWCDSLKRRPVDFYRTHNTATNDPEREVYNSWIEWANMHKQEKNFYCKDYIDWLHNWKNLLEEVHQKTGWTRITEEWENVTVVPMSPPVTFDKSRYRR